MPLLRRTYLNERRLGAANGQPTQPHQQRCLEMATTVTKSASRPLTEIQRQEQAVAALGEDFQFPLFNGRHAVESQRKSGYRNSARAAREIVDNAYEAGAKNVHVVFRRPAATERGKHQRKDSVAAVAFIDDGPGMIPAMARFALSWGGGTRFDSPMGIGRFGFGLPNASINQCRRVEVYTRTSSKDSWQRVVLDITPEKLDDIPPTGMVSVDPPAEAELPDFVQDYLKKNRKQLPLKSGTIVIWDRPDRLTVRSGANLKELMLDDFGVVYRNLLGDFNLVVDGVTVKKVDPLFLSPDAMLYKPPKDGGAECTFDREIPVKYYRDPQTGNQHLEILETSGDLEEARKDSAVEAVGVVSVRVARFPYGFAAEEIRVNGSKQRLPKDSEEYKRLQIRKKRRGISFLRAGREIDTLDSLPNTTADKSNGLGDWPTLQAYALHWGIEVRFNPSLDEAFGIGNDKQTVNPIEDFWRVLSQREVDQAARKEQQYQQKTRKTEEEEEAKRQHEDPNQPNPATDAAASAESAMGRTRQLPKERTEESQERFDEEVQRRAGETGGTRDEVEDAIRQEAERKRYGIKFFQAEGGVFMRPDFGNGLQRVAELNTEHPFFKVFYAPLAGLPNPRPRQAVDLLLLSLAKSELEAENDVKLALQHQREAEWSPFLKLGLSILDQLHAADPEEEEEEV